MNSDSFFDSEFFQEHKGLITVFATVSLAFFTIFWLYKGLKSNERINPVNNENLNNLINTNTNVNLNNMPNVKKIEKKRITISAQDILYKDLNSIDITYVYPTLDALNKYFDLYLIIMINENDDTEKIAEKFSVLYEDKIVYKHVR